MQTINNCVVIDDKDLGKSSEDLLIDLIYESTKIRIPRPVIRFFKPPQELDARPDLKYDPNTFIGAHVDAEYDFRLSRLAGFMYRRRELQEYLERNGVGPSFRLEVTRFPMTARELWREQIAPLLPYPVNEDEIEDFQIDDHDLTQIEFKVLKTSLIWCRGAVVKLKPINPALWKLVPIQQFLPGFLRWAA